MKTALFLAISIVGLLCGCGESRQEQIQRENQDMDIKQLKVEVASLQAALSEDEDVISNYQATGDLNNTNITDLIFDVWELSASVSNVTERVISLESWHDAVFASHSLTPEASPATPAPVNSDYGIPDDVLAGIKAKAANDWPDNYDMQNFQLGLEVGAYKQLHPQ
jgi:hypothetical protein